MVLKRKIAYIDLTRREVRVRDIPLEMRRLYLGGRGLDMYLLYNHVEKGVDPLSPDNVLLVSAGLLVGTPLAAGRTHVGGKSPLTGIVGSTNMGGFFSPELRLAGFDHLVIKGRAERPTYLWVHDGQVEFMDASGLWGMKVFEAQEAIRKDLGDPDVKSMVIGPAGENLVRFANVMTGLKNSGGRTGMGCLMGSKRLKAIAAKGTMDLELKHPDEYLEYALELNERMASSRWGRASGKWGTMVIWNYTNTWGGVRVRNFQANQLHYAELIEPQNIEKWSIGVAGCYGCVVHCRHRYVYSDPKYGTFYDEGPEYTSLGAFGAEVGCNRMEYVLVGNHLVNSLGLDTLETGSMIAWAIELYERGVIDDGVTGGLKLRWGDPDLVFQLVEMIAYRKGIGDILADGPRPAMEKFGPESAYYCIQIKGMSNLQSDERPTPSLALNIATATRGSDHLRSRPAIDLYGLPVEVLEQLYEATGLTSTWASYQGKAKMVIWQEKLYAVVDSLGICKYHTAFISATAPKWEEWVKLLYYATGLEFTKAELMEIGERIYNIERMFLVREGLSRKDDYLPERYYKEPCPTGLPIAKGRYIDRAEFDKMLDEYYDLHGWDRNGIPKPETLQRLGLDKEPSHKL